MTLQGILKKKFDTSAVNVGD